MLPVGKKGMVKASPPTHAPTAPCPPKTPIFHSPCPSPQCVPTGGDVGPRGPPGVQGPPGPPGPAGSGGDNTFGISNLGNTLGTSGVISGPSLQLLLAGGNNITLSQSINGNSATITISAGAGGTGANNFSGGFSTLGNTSGNTGVASQQLILAGGNNVTLSGSTNGGSITITVSAANQTVQTQNLFDLTLSGNTAGVLALVSSGTLTLAGGNNITLSQIGNAITISAFNQSVQPQSTQPTIQSISAGTTQITTGQVVFSNSNGISFGANGQTITASHDGLTSQSNQAASAANGSFTFQTLSFLDSNGISFGTSGSAITASYNPAAASYTFSGGMSTGGNTSGDTGFATDRLNLVGGNNVTLSGSTNAGSMTITISAASQSVQPQSTQPTIQSLSAGTTRITTGEAVFSNSNGISFGANGQTITASYTVPNQTVQTQNMFDLTLSGNTSGTLALVSSGTLTLAGGNNITLSQVGNAITISGANSAPQTTQPTIQSLSAGTTRVTTGEAVFSNSNGISFGVNGQTITASHNGLTSQSNQAASGSNGSFTFQTLSFLNSNGISFGSSGSAITASYNPAAASYSFSGGMSTLGNTSGDTGFASDRLNLVGGNRITLSGSTDAGSMSITISGANQSTQPGIQSISGGTTRVTTGEVVFSNSNGISFGVNGQTITASYTVPSVTTFSGGMSNLGNTSGATGFATQRLLLVGGNNVTLSGSINAGSMTIIVDALNQVASAANGSFTFQTLSFSNLNGISFGTSAGSAITASYTVPVQTVESQSIGVSNLGNTSGTSGIASGAQVRALFAGGNNITLSQSLNGASATITISAANQTVQTQNVVDVTLSGNTAGVMALISSGTLTLAGGNNITLSQVGNAVTISGAAQSAQPGIQSISGGTTRVTTGEVVFSNSNGISFGVNGQTVTASYTVPSVTTFSGGMSTAGNTSGDTGFASQRLALVGGDNITLSGSTNGGSMTITISGGAGAGALSAGMSTNGNTSGDTGFASQRLNLVGGNNVTLSGSTNGGSMSITVSAANQTVQTQNVVNVTLDGNTAGALALISSGTMTLAGGDNIVLSQAGNAVTISAVNQTSAMNVDFGISTMGNTDGTTGLINGPDIRYIFVGQQNVTLSQALGLGASTSRGTLSIRGPVLSTIADSMGMSNLGNTSGTTGIVSSSANFFVFAGGNNITLSQSLNGNSGTITISAANQLMLTQNIGVSNLGNTSGTSGMASGDDIQYVIVASNGLIGSQSLNGASGTLSLINSWSTATTVSQVTSMNVLGANAGRFALEGHQHAGVAAIAAGSTQGNTMNFTDTQFGTWVMVGTGNCTVGAITATNGINTMFLSCAAAQMGMSTMGNTAGTTGMAAAREVFVGSNNITLSQSMNTASVLGTLTILGPTLLSVGVSNLGETAGSTGLVSNRMVLVGSNGIELSQSTGGLSSATLTISPSPYLSFLEPFGPFLGTTLTVSDGRMSIMPFQNFWPITVSRMNFPVSVSMSTSSNSSYAGTVTLSVGMYTLNGSTLSLATSGSQSYAWTNSSNNSTVSLSGMRIFTVPASLNLTPGDYWIALYSRISTQNANWLTMNPFFQGVEPGGLTFFSGLFGANSAASIQLIPGLGRYSTSFTTAMPNSVGMTEVSQSRAYDNLKPYINFINVTF